MRFVKAFVFLALAVLFCSSAGLNAQSFTVEKLKVEGGANLGEYPELKSMITNNTANRLHMRVTKTQNMPAGWEAQICFFQNCYPPSVNEKIDYMDGNYSEELKIGFLGLNSEGRGEVEVTVENLDNATETVKVLFILTVPSVTSVASPIPASLALNQNYPNPFAVFSNVTRIGFSVPKSGQVSLSVYDLLGKKVATLMNGTRSAGVYSVLWDGRDSNGSMVPPGVYIYRLNASGQIMTRRMLITR